MYLYFRFKMQIRIKIIQVYFVVMGFFPNDKSFEQCINI